MIALQICFECRFLSIHAVVEAGSATLTLEPDGALGTGSPCSDSGGGLLPPASIEATPNARAGEQVPPCIWSSPIRTRQFTGFGGASSIGTKLGWALLLLLLTSLLVGSILKSLWPCAASHSPAKRGIRSIVCAALA
jgi:hypothetical protein